MSIRLRLLRNAMRREKIPALAVTDLRNVRYLTGFTGTAGACLVTRRAAIFFSDFRYRAQAVRQVAKPFRFADSRGRAAVAAAAEAKRLRIQTLFFEEENLTYAAHRRLKKEAGSVRLKPCAGLVEDLRLRKDPTEVRRLRRGAKINREGLKVAAGSIRPGVRERDVARILEEAMREEGASASAFDTIVASGPRGAMPHGIASGRKIRRGDLITIDFGAVVDGYHADTTRVFSLGMPSAKAREICGIVLEAQRAAVAAVAPGVKCSEVDSAARRIIEDRGFGKAFGHGVGHGLGLDIHEGPRLGPEATDVLRPGMVVTVEPGIYLPGWGGGRIEDMVLVTETGREVLTRSIPKELVVL